MKSAKELAESARSLVQGGVEIGYITNRQAHEFAAAFDRLDAIDSAVPDEAKEVEAFVTEFKALECKGPQTQFEHAVGALYRRTKTLLAIVQRQAADTQAALNLARGYEQERETAREEAARWQRKLHAEYKETEKLNSALEVARKAWADKCATSDKECDRLKELVDEFKAASMLDVGGDPDGVTPQLLEKHITALVQRAEVAERDLATLNQMYGSAVEKMEGAMSSLADEVAKLQGQPRP